MENNVVLRKEGSSGAYALLTYNPKTGELAVKINTVFLSVNAKLDNDNHWVNDGPPKYNSENHYILDDDNKRRAEDISEVLEMRHSAVFSTNFETLANKIGTTTFLRDENLRKRHPGDFIRALEKEGFEVLEEEGLLSAPRFKDRGEYYIGCLSDDNEAMSKEGYQFLDLPVEGGVVAIHLNAKYWTKSRIISYDIVDDKATVYKLDPYGELIVDENFLRENGISKVANLVSLCKSQYEVNIRLHQLNELYQLERG